MRNFRLFVGGCLTVLAASTMMQAQTLTQDWAVKKNLPTAGNARWATVVNGKIVTNDRTTSTLYYIDKDDITTVTGLGTAGTAITSDQAGNLIISNSFVSNASCTNFKVLPAGETELVDLTVTLPDGVTAGRMDFIGRATGDIMSKDGGAFYVAPNGSEKIAKIFIINGVQDTDLSTAFVSKNACSTDGIVQPTKQSSNDEFVSRPTRQQKCFSHPDNGEDVLYSVVGTANATAGGDAFILNDVLYTIEPCGTNYVDGFQIVDRSTNTVVATHEAEFSTPAAKPNQNVLIAKAVDSFTVAIYQYVPGQMAAKYTFELPKPKMYIIGQSEGSAWNPTDGIEMTWVGDYVYNATITTKSTAQNIGFTTVLAENNDDGGWSYVNANRYGLSTNDQDGSLAEDLTISKNTNAVRVGLGTFFVRINLLKGTLYIAPTKMYVIGNTNKADGHGWSSTDESYMAESDPEKPGVFVFNPIDMKVADKAVGEEGADDLSYFAFVTGIDKSWDVVNGSRWCPNKKDGEMTKEEEYTDFGKYSDGAFCIKNGAYKLTLDLNAKEVFAEYLTTTGVEKVGNDAARVVGGNGTISILGEATNVSVYNVAGQAVALNTPLRTINAARGMYIVTVDGKAVKVFVK